MIGLFRAVPDSEAFHYFQQATCSLLSDDSHGLRPEGRYLCDALICISLEGAQESSSRRRPLTLRTSAISVIRRSIKKTLIIVRSLIPIKVSDIPIPRADMYEC